MAEKFQKKKLNRDDHKKMDNAAKHVRKGGVILGVLTTCVIVAKKNGPKIISTAKNIITKV